jgi:hypothetical protein
LVTSKPVWARPTLTSCNGLYSKCKALYLAARYKGDNYRGENRFELGNNAIDWAHGWGTWGLLGRAGVAEECSANGLTNLLASVCEYQTFSTAPSCLTKLRRCLTWMIWLWRLSTFWISFKRWPGPKGGSRRGDTDGSGA